jgi:hypothetical protein
LFGSADANIYSAVVTTSEDNLLETPTEPGSADSSTSHARTEDDRARYRYAEYQSMRATIRQRGTARMLLVPAALVAWAGLTIGAAAVITVALSTLIPLLVLVAAFESTFALHVNVERLGRYLQVFHEPANAGWEHVTMDYGRRFPGGGDPLFGRIFIFATSVNFFPAALGGEPWEVAIVAVCHFAFIYRVRKAQSLAAASRAEDLRRFEALRSSSHSPFAGQTHSAERPNDQ